jgi:hypothetical protein
MAYERVAGPLGSARVDVAAALVSAVIANVNREANGKAFEIKDFMPEWQAESNQSMSPDEVWQSINQVLGSRG